MIGCILRELFCFGKWNKISNQRSFDIIREKRSVRKEVIHAIKVHGDPSASNY